MTHGDQVMQLHQFELLLECGSATVKGFIAVLAEWIKLTGAQEIEELQKFEAVTTFDGDSLWQRRAIPPKMHYGHASGTLELNPVSHENKDMPARWEKLVYDYCTTPLDYLSMATPWRWPTGSPALQSVVVRLKTFVSGSLWRGTGFQCIMHTVADTYNNWGLRPAFNEPHVHTPVPWFTWSKPLKRGSVYLGVVRQSGECVRTYVRMYVRT